MVANFFKKKTPPSTPTNQINQPVVLQTTPPQPQPLNLFQSLNVKTNKNPATNFITPLQSNTIATNNIIKQEDENNQNSIQHTSTHDDNLNHSIEILVEKVELDSDSKINNEDKNNITLPLIQNIKPIQEESNRHHDESNQNQNNNNIIFENKIKDQEISGLSLVDKNIKNLNLMKEDLEKKIINIKDFFKELNLKKLELNLLINDNLLSIKKYQEEQLIAVENENYDLASNIEYKMTELSNENKISLESFFKLMKSQIDNSGQCIIDFSSEEILLTYHQDSESILDELRIERENQELAFQKYQEGIQEQLRSQKDEAQARQDQVEREAKHLQLDREILESDEKVLNEKIKVETEPLFKDREDVQLKKIEIQNEIDDLLKIISAKKEEQTQLDKQIDEIDQKIQNTRGKFANEEKRISLESLNVLDRENKIEEIRKEASKLLEELNRLSNPTENSEFSSLASIRDCTDQHNNFLLEYEAILDSTESESKKAKEIYDKMSHHFEQVNKLLQQSETIQNTITEISNELSRQQKQKLDLKNTITSIEELVPQLEISKNQAKDSKKFTEAANLLNEIKVQQQLLSEKKKQLQQLTEQNSLSSTTVTNLEMDLKSLKDKIDSENQNIYSLFTN